jgi:hypothetical protein
MYIKSTTLLAGALALCAFAAPLPECDDDIKTDVASAGALTAETIIAIAPATASCTSTDLPDECADATRAATAINKAFETYEITAKGEQAALVAYMLFESVNFKFKHNKNPAPGRPGQGTRMMAVRLPYSSSMPMRHLLT